MSAKSYENVKKVVPFQLKRYLIKSEGERYVGLRISNFGTRRHDLSSLPLSCSAEV